MTSSDSSINQKFLDSQAEVEKNLGEPLSISGLCGELKIFQRLNGYRHSIDDATTAWYALQKCPDANETLDLGTGIGTVGLTVLWGLPATASLVCIEAQEISFKLLKANIECNGLSERVEAIHADIREVDLGRKFPLITGSPPYFPPNAGIIPSDSQKAHARFELRGDVGDYARAARKHLADDGTFIFCFPFQQKERCIKLVTEAGFKIVSIKDVIPNADKPALFSLYSARLNWDQPPVEEPALIVSDKDGKYTSEMLEVQKARGFGQLGTNL